jgi:type II secretory pathway pseudopilin PulG
MNTGRTNINATRRRRAMTMIEIISALAVLGTLFVVSAQLLSLTRVQRRGVVQRHTALVEAQNALERITATPLDTPGLDARLSQLVLAPHAEQLLPDGRITARTQESQDLDKSDATAGYQLTVEVSWQLASGQSAAPVRLTTWVYPPVDPSPAKTTTDVSTEVDP